MRGKTNASSRGTFVGTDAILRVQAPAGCIVTITKGNITKSDHGHLNAQDFSKYDYYFMIHAAQFDYENAWTVSTTYGIIPLSKEIIIDRADEYDVKLKSPWLVYNGDECVAETGGWRATHSSSSVTASISHPTGEDQMQLNASSSSTWKDAIYDITNPLDYTNLDTIYIDFAITALKSDSVNNTKVLLCVIPEGQYVWNPSNSSNKDVAYLTMHQAKTTLARTTKSLSVASITGVYNLLIGVALTTQNPSITLKVYNIWTTFLNEN